MYYNNGGTQKKWGSLIQLSGSWESKSDVNLDGQCLYQMNHLTGPGLSFCFSCYGALVFGW
ncbi:hypothetical protein ACQP3J_27875, partial [Escherichia coli]